MAGRTVLIVDDEEAVRQIAERIIGDHGYRVCTAQSGEEALDFCRAKPGEVGLVLLDMGLPGMDGAQCMTMIKEAQPETKVVVSSGSIELDETAMIDLGAERLLAKPYRLAELLKCVRELAGEPDGATEN